MLLRAGLLVLGVVSLCSCNTPFASNDKDQYLESQNAPNMIIKSPLTTSNLSDFYTLPAAPEHPKKVNMLPPVS
ncbi:MAG: hypothetical protein P1U39_03840 [Legionellaceae bacterium]|nr:hypothetical protein [Legionellaceae bacterium]